MKINHLSIRGYQRVAHLDEGLSTVNLFAGSNESGKSSVLEAVRFAMTGVSPRVQLKRDYGQLVRQGHGKGAEIILSHADGPIHRVIKDGKRKDATDVRALYSESLPIVLSSQSLGRMTEKDRRSSLLSMVTLDYDAETVSGMLEKRGIDADRIKHVMPHLRSGFEPMRQIAQEEARDAKGGWRQVTGEAWGSDKGESWEPAKVAVQELDQDALNKRLNDLTDELDSVNQSIGAHQERSMFSSDQRKRLSGLAEQLEGRRKALSDMEAERSSAESVMEWARTSEMTLTCPRCEALLVMNDGQLAHSGEVTQCEKSFDQATREYNEACENVNEARALVDQSEKAEADLKSGSDDSGSEVDIQALRDRTVEIRNDIQGIKSALRDYEQSIRAAGDADQDKKEAQRLHNAVINWTALADQLSPTGIPGELMTNALKPINDRLAETARRTGWGQVVIGTDCDIRVSGTLYDLLSESAQWRADAAIAESIAWNVGPATLFLDRVDVLDMTGRGQWAKWMRSLSTEYENLGTIFCAGTFKAKPKIPGVSVFWLENGEVI